MDSGSGSASILYDTLPPLTFSGAVSDPDAESYAVFRNTITSTAGPCSEIPAAEYFSLDVTASETPRRHLFTTPRARPSLPDANDDASPLTWLRSDRRFKSPMLQLHKEILDFCHFISPTTDEQATRAAAIERISDVIKYIWPHCKVDVFGSFMTGLYLPTSDIDVVILDSKVTTPQMGLHALARALSQRSVTKKMQVIAKARVPIIKFVEKQSGIAFDISFDIDSGPKAASYIKDAVDRIPPLRPLCLILKVFLHQRELNEVYTGGIGSYTLLAMLIACLQMHWRGSQGCKNLMEHNLGILLVNFFDFYGRKLNVVDVGISCNSRGTFFLKSDKGFLNRDRPNLLSVEDPQAPDNDIGRNSYNFYKVKSAFSMAYSCLTDTKTIMSLCGKKSILGTIIRPDQLLLDRKGGHHGELTFDNLLPGAGEPVSQLFAGENDVICNWPFLDDVPLPRENTSLENDYSSSRKRKSAKAKHKSDKREDIENSVRMQEENGSKSTKKVKKRKKGYHDDGLDRKLPYHFSRSR